MKKNVPVCNFRIHFLRYYSVRSQETFNEILLRYRGLLFAVCNIMTPPHAGRKKNDDDRHMYDKVSACGGRCQFILFWHGY